MDQIRTFLSTYQGMTTALWVAALFVAAFLVHFIVKFILIQITHRLIDGSKFVTVRDIVQSGITRHLANAVPAMLISTWIEEVPGLNAHLVSIVRHTADAFITLLVAMAIAAGLRLGGKLWQRRHSSSGHSITGYVQIATIGVYVVAIILMIAVLINRSPLILISSLGALTAVLILVFQDTLLSLVASIQLTTSDIVKVGDWIEMPSLNVNGTVIDLSLYTVSVRNFDNTYSHFPVRKLVSDPFKNWRGMKEAGGRRISRSIPLDQTTVRFIDDEEIPTYAHLRRLADYISHKSLELSDWNAQLGADGQNPANRRRLTNLGLFRAYATNYLQTHPALHTDMTLMVRHLDPGPDGLPVQVYCFTRTTDWAAYEAIQADIFDHLISMLPEFGLKVFQSS